MTYNTSESEQRKAAANDLALKLKLESSLMREIKKYFNKVAKEFGNTYINTNSVLNVSQFDNELSDILGSHYDKTSIAFDDQIRSTLDITDAQLDQRIDLSLAQTGVKFVHDSTNQISNTTQKDLNKAVGTTLLALVTAGAVITSSKVASQSKQEFVRVTSGRVDTIGQDQTQFAAENAKYTEMTSLAGAGIPLLDKPQDETSKKKRWSAILDAKTRPQHAAVDGKIVDYNKPFIVGNELLMFPRDTSLGASAWNVINCRCSAIYILS